MKAKKVFVVILLFTLLFSSSVFAAGQNESAKASKSGLTHINMWYNATQTEVGPLPNDWIGYQILKDKFGIELEASSLPSSNTDQDMKIQAASAADQLPDFFVANREVWSRLASNGMLSDVTDCYAKMPNRTAIMFDQDAINFTSINGRSYGFGTPSIIVKNEGLVVRKDWLNNLGLAEPKTTEELLNVLRAFTYNDPDGNGKNDTYGYGAFVEVNTYEAYPGRRFEPLMGAFGVDGTWNMSKADFGLQIHKPEFYDYMVFMKTIIDEGLIDPNWMAYKKDDFRAAWKQGKFGMMREQNSALGSENNYRPFDKNFPDGEWVVLDAPVGPNGRSSIGPVVRGLRIWCVSQRAVDEGKLDKICEMFEWMASGEGYLLCGWGQEGISYTLQDGIPVSTDTEYGFVNSIGQTYIQLRSMAFNYSSNEELISRYPDWQATKKIVSPLGFLRTMQTKQWTPANGADGMPTPSTDLKTFYEQGLAEFFTGKRTLTRENWNAFLSQFDAIGGKAWEQAGYDYAVANNYQY